MPIWRFTYVVVAVAAFFSTYLLLQDEQAFSSLMANGLENPQEPAREGKSDRLKGVNEAFGPKLVRLQKFVLSAYDHFSGRRTPKQDRLSYLAYYPYSEVPPDRKPADMALDYLKHIPLGTPVEEIKRASAAFGLDFNFMKAVARIESDFDPKQRTGSYMGLFQLSNYEFAKYGSGDIFNPRDNAVAAAAKFVTVAALFELSTHKKATISDLYLIHQQGSQGAAEHVSHPQRLAWQSMCATDEGKQKGAQWCKRAIWGNTTPEVKHLWKSVEDLTSGAFVKMWQDRVDHFYVRYSEAGG